MADLRRKIWIKTYGCQMNMRDSETLKALLSEVGHTIVEKESDAEIALLNTCSIRDLAESKAIGKAGRLLKNKQKNARYRVGILGCMASRQKAQLLKILPDLDWIIPPQNLSEVPEIIRETLEKDAQTCTVANIPEAFEFRCYEQKLPTSPCRFVPIQQGCNMRCSYCIVPTTRGEQQNRPAESILYEIRQAVADGVKEVTLLGQIVNAYFDKNSGTNFVKLLHDIHAIDGLERMRFMSPHPAFFSEDLIKCYAELPKLCPSIHLPIQSGSNRILEAMRRRYTREKILQIISDLRKLQPQIAISTDIIVGYPGETEEDFQQTYDLFDTIGFDMAYIFKYSPRPTTTAAEQQKTELGISEAVKEERNQRLLTLLTHYSTRYNAQFLHTTQPILVEGQAHRGEHRFWGRNVYNKKIIFSGTADLIGTFQNIYIEKTSSSVLEGRL